MLGACGEVTPAPPPIAAAPATPTFSHKGVTKADLGYPHIIKWLTTKDIWPDEPQDSFSGSITGAFLTNDEWPQVLEVYHKKLTPLGYTVGASEYCLPAEECKDIFGFEALLSECGERDALGNRQCDTSQQINFYAISGKASQQERQKRNVPEYISQLVKPGQTLIVFNGAVYRPFKPVPYPATTAALVTGTPRPQPSNPTQK